MSKNRDAAEIRAGGGVKVEFAFSLGTAQIVCATQEAHEARAWPDKGLKVSSQGL